MYKVNMVDKGTLRAAKKLRFTILNHLNLAYPLTPFRDLPRDISKLETRGIEFKCKQKVKKRFHIKNRHKISFKKVCHVFIEFSFLLIHYTLLE